MCFKVNTVCITLRDLNIFLKPVKSTNEIPLNGILQGTKLKDGDYITILYIRLYFNYSYFVCFCGLNLWSANRWRINSDIMQPRRILYCIFAVKTWYSQFKIGILDSNPFRNNWDFMSYLAFICLEYVIMLNDRSHKNVHFLHLLCPLWLFPLLGHLLTFKLVYCTLHGNETYHCSNTALCVWTRHRFPGRGEGGFISVTPTHQPRIDVPQFLFSIFTLIIL